MDEKNLNHEIETVTETVSNNAEQETTTYRVYEESPTNPAEPEKKAKGSGWTKTVVAAVIFGLVAGASFKGVDIAYDKLTNKGNTEKQETVKQTVDNVEQVETVTDGNEVYYNASTIADNVMPSIVSITTKSIEIVRTWFQQYEQEVEGSGSGIIIQQNNNDLYIITNYHVVEGATSLTICFQDQSLMEATVKGYNADADLAVLVVDMTKLSEETIKAIKIAQLGNSDNISVGDAAFAIGNALGYGQSFTGGYISATKRTLEQNPIGLIQTDAAINPGNSGGALVNAKGEVIGVNSSKLVDSTVEGMGFAIPINEAMKLLQGIIDGTSGNVDSSTATEEYNPFGDEYDDFNEFDDFFDFFGFGDDKPEEDERKDEEDGNVIPSQNKAFLGIAGTDVTEDYSSYLNMPSGVYITQVTADSPAAKAGVKAGDVITNVDNQAILSMEGLRSYIGTKQPGDVISIVLQRKGDNGEYTTMTVSATLVENTVQ